MEYKYHKKDYAPKEYYLDLKYIPEFIRILDDYFKKSENGQYNIKKENYS